MQKAIEKIQEQKANSEHFFMFWTKELEKLTEGTKEYAEASSWIDVWYGYSMAYGKTLRILKAE